MVNTELNCMQLFIRYIRLVTTFMLDDLPRAAEHCDTVCYVWCIIEQSSEILDRSVRMCSIMAGLGYHEFGIRIWPGAQGGTQISTGRDDFAGGSAFLLTLSESLEIELSDFEAENATRKGDYLWQVAEIVIGGIPTVREVCFRCLFMSLSRILLEHSVSTNLIDPMAHQVGHQKVHVSILLLGNIYLVADTILLGIYFTPLLGWCPSFSIGLLEYLSLLHVFGSESIGIGLSLFACLPNWENIFEGVKTMLVVLHVVQCCNIVRFVLSIYTQF